jgi:CRP/FNR family cyclic AMP-dependent transcriptional regulator
MAFDAKAFLEQAGDGKTVLIYKAPATIFKQDDPANEVFYLQQGLLKEAVASDQGKEAVTGMIESGMFFGTGALDGNGKRRSTVVAVTACTVTAITRRVMNTALQEPEFVHMFLNYLLHRNNKIEAEKVDLLLNSSEERLVQKLLTLAHAERGLPSLIGPEVTQEMLAEMIGRTRQRVNFLLIRFRRMGFIRLDRRGIDVLPAITKVLIRRKPE